METKEYLEQVKQLDAEIRFREDEIIVLRGRAEGITSAQNDRTKVKSSRAEDRLDAVLDLLDRQIAAQREAVCRLNEKIVEISDEITKLDNLDEVMCLTYRFIRLLPWKDVSETMGISERHLQRICARGVAHLDELRSKI
ncbi:MAG: hypothetical protein IK118_06805 [Clostridia bacterium]|nr:hypothetical protein [Clostridia bacterium]MBR5428040.1 hypothetical protein [Clostridia bacterium]